MKTEGKKYAGQYADSKNWTITIVNYEWIENFRNLSGLL